jgi:hypothetical protein
LQAGLLSSRDHGKQQIEKMEGKFMKAIRIRADGSIKLPQEILRLFPTTSDLAVWTQGDMIVLKRLKPLKPSKIAERAPEEEMPLEEVAAEVHQLRQEKRNRRG